MWKDLKKSQTKLLEIKTTMSELKNTLDGINGSLHIAEEKISKFEGLLIEIKQTSVPGTLTRSGRGMATPEEKVSMRLDRQNW